MESEYDEICVSHVRGMRMRWGSPLIVFDLVEGREVVQLIGHTDHVMCGSMS